MMLEVRHFFDAAHQLEDSRYLVSKGCRNLHGHTYHVIVTCFGENERSGMMVDFKAIKDIIDELDHTAIFGPTPLAMSIERLLVTQKVIRLEVQPTAENIAQHLYYRIHQTYPDLSDITIKLCEGYKGDLRSSYITVNHE